MYSLISRVSLYGYVKIDWFMKYQTFFPYPPAQTAGKILKKLFFYFDKKNKLFENMKWKKWEKHFSKLNKRKMFRRKLKIFSFPT